MIDPSRFDDPNLAMLSITERACDCTDRSSRVHCYEVGAFRDRGQGDFLVSHDLEDIVTVVDGRPSLADEIRIAATDLRTYLRQQFQTLTNSSDFLDALPGHLPGDGASQARLPELIRRLRALAQ